MSVLTGPEIEKQIADGKILLDPYIQEHVGPNSVDLRLHEDLMVYKGTRETPDWKPLLDMDHPAEAKLLKIPETGLILQPGVLYLGRTVEKVGSRHFLPFIDGRSSVGRLGMGVHVTAGFFDTGFEGTVTLEITVVHPLRVYPGRRICQVWFETITGDVRLYQGRYQGQTDPTPSRMHLNTGKTDERSRSQEDRPGE